MQRLFSAFPAGLPGVGLFLLRVSLAAGLALRVGVGLGPDHSGRGMPILPILALVGGAALVVGFLTPAAAVLSIASEAGKVFLSHGATNPAVLDPGGLCIMANAVAVALLGPGWFSIDSRLFGRRVIHIEPRPKRPAI
jgi:uncharacterized membrane protein YphA (DoxX/SURF4 family)